MPNIVPISDLRNYSSVLDNVAVGSPVYLTKNGRKRYTAEILYRFISGNNEFTEEHTGLADVLIEKEILVECLRRGVADGKLW